MYQDIAKSGLKASNRFDCELKTARGEALLQQVLERRLSARMARSTARKLLAEFGEIKQVMRASNQRLQRVLSTANHPAIAALSEMRVLLEALVGEDIRSRPLLDDSKSVIRYARAFLSGERREQFHVLLLDAGYHLVAHECLQIGTVNHVAVYPREVLASALNHQAMNIILVHNHPGGNPGPSPADIETTRMLARAGSYLGIEVTDHIIIGAETDFSFRDAGLVLQAKRAMA